MKEIVWHLLHFVKTLVVFRDSCIFEHGGKPVGLRNNLKVSGFDFLYLCNVMNAGLVLLEVFVEIFK